MANGDIVTSGGELFGYAHYTLLDAQTGASNGVWVDIRQYHGFKTVEISGVGTGTVQIRGSLAATKPADSAHASQIGSDITADGITTFADNVQWIKVRKSAAGDSTATTAMLKALLRDERSRAG